MYNPHAATVPPPIYFLHNTKALFKQLSCTLLYRK